MLLVSCGGEPALVKALGVDGVCSECELSHESIRGLAGRVREARDCGLTCEWVGPDWNLIEKTIHDASLLNVAVELLEEMRKIDEE